MIRSPHCWAALFAAVLIAASPAAAQSKEVFASGLVAPQRIIRLPNGKFLVSETGAAVNAARVSMLSSGGLVTPLLEGLPGGVDGQGDFSGATGLAAEGSTLYVAIGEGDAQRVVNGVSLPNPEGVSSPIVSSILEFELDRPVEDIMSGFTLTEEDHATLGDGFSVELENADGATASVRVLADFPNFIPDPNVPYRPSNPYGLAISEAHPGVLFLADASFDALVEIDRETGRSRRLVRFGKVPNPTRVGPPVSDYVPTSVRPYAGGLLVSNLVGFPFAAHTARVAYVDVEGRTASTFIANLSSALDIAVVQRPDRARFYTLEFSTAFLQGGPGRLMRYDSPDGEVVVGDLVTPTSMAVDESTGDIYITELATGNVVRVTPE